MNLGSSYFFGHADSPWWDVWAMGCVCLRGVTGQRSHAATGNNIEKHQLALLKLGLYSAWGPRPGPRTFFVSWRIFFC